MNRMYLLRRLRSNPSRPRRIITVLVQGALIAAVYFGVFSVLMYPVVDGAGMI